MSNNKKRRWRLWEDVPQSQRVDEKFIRGRVGALDEEWVQSELAKLKEVRCPVAVQWGEKWHPCGHYPVEGSKLCAAHTAGSIQVYAERKRRTKERQRFRERERMRRERIPSLLNDPDYVQPTSCYAGRPGLRDLHH